MGLLRNLYFWATLPIRIPYRLTMLVLSLPFVLIRIWFHGVGAAWLIHAVKIRIEEEHFDKIRAENRLATEFSFLRPLPIYGDDYRDPPTVWPKSIHELRHFTQQQVDALLRHFHKDRIRIKVPSHTPLREQIWRIADCMGALI